MSLLAFASCSRRFVHSSHRITYKNKSHARIQPHIPRRHIISVYIRLDYHNSHGFENLRKGAFFIRLFACLFFESFLPFLSSLNSRFIFVLSIMPLFCIFFIPLGRMRHLVIIHLLANLIGALSFHYWLSEI